MSTGMVCLIVLIVSGIYTFIMLLYIKRLKNIEQKMNMDNIDSSLKHTSADKRIKNCENAITTLFSDLDKMSDTLIKIVDMDKADSERIDTIIQYLKKHVENEEDDNEE